MKLICCTFSLGTDIKKEIGRIKEHMMFQFNKCGKKAIYDPDDFESFCLEAGATTLFANLVDAVCTSRQDERRHDTNRKIVVSIIYKLCYALSQRCNFLQRDNMLFMISNNLNKEAMNTERRMGNSLSSRTGYRILHDADRKHKVHINTAIEEAIENEWLIIGSIDDYTSIHTHRRPTNEKASTAVNMCTIVMSIFKDIKAIPWQEATELHDPNVVNTNALTGFITSQQNLYSLRSTYASIMPSWLRVSFFDPQLTRQRLSAHEYYQSADVQQLRSFDNLHLIEFKEQTLKSMSGFETAMSWILDTKLKQYLEKFCILMPGDHPAQFYLRQIVYSNSFMNSNTVNHENQDNTGYSTQQQTYCSVDPSMATSDVRNVSSLASYILLK